MTNDAQLWNRLLFTSRRAATATMAIGMVLVLTVGIAESASHPTYSVVYNFTGGTDGATPYAGLTIDAAGNIYGTTLYGGSASGEGYGVVFQLKPNRNGFTFNSIYRFTGGADGAAPVAKVILGPNGSLYGTAHAGGKLDCGVPGFDFPGCGVVFKLAPQPNQTWTQSVLYTFTGAGDGANPWGNVILDQAGNLYGTAEFGGDTSCVLTSTGCGTVFKLTPSGNSWTQSVLYTFTNGADGSRPYANLTFDASGNLYGTNFLGAGAGCNGVFQNPGCGTVFKLTPSGSGWTESTVYPFTGGSDGGWSQTGVLVDTAGNLYTATSSFGSGNAGTVVELSPSNGSWAFNLLASFSGARTSTQGGPRENLVMDQAGNIYGTTTSAGAYGYGSVFKMTRSGNTWIYTSLYDFRGDNNGFNPISNIVFDASGNLYGTTQYGGSAGKGVVWKIKP
jgi:uncharacterized repeat protein (TIGR03803 family)